MTDEVLLYELKPCGNPWLNGVQKPFLESTATQQGALCKLSGALRPQVSVT